MSLVKYEFDRERHPACYSPLPRLYRRLSMAKRRLFQGQVRRFLFVRDARQPRYLLRASPTGQVLELEVKDTRGRLNANQVAFKERIEKAGGRYLIARQVDDVINALAA